MKDSNSLAHTKRECKYHIVFAPKCKCQILYGNIKEDICKTLRKVCECIIMEQRHAMTTYKCSLSIPPKFSASQIVEYLKRKSSLMIFEKYANMKYKYGNRYFWCSGYYVSTVGGNRREIEEYIRNQLQEDKADDHLTMKEFIDPFTGKLVGEGKR